MVLSQHRYTVGSFFSRVNMELALNELKSAGFPMEQISIIAKDVDDDWLNGLSKNAQFGQERVPLYTLTGSVLGAIGGCLVGLGILAVPGIVVVMTAGTALSATLVGTGVGIASGSLIEACRGLKTPKDRARVYSDRFSLSEYLVIVDGTDDMVLRAESIFGKSCSSKVWVCTH